MSGAWEPLQTRLVVIVNSRRKKEQIRRAVKENVKKRIIVAITTSLEDRIKNCRVYRPAWFVFLVFLNLSVTLHVPLMVVPNLATRCA